NLKAMEKAYPKFMVECVHELANRLLAKTVPRTPSDKGDLRRGWTIGQVNVSSNGAQIEVFNPVAYSPYVEYGHRTANHQGWVEGRFMMTISVDELEREIPAIMERKMARFISRYLG
ncbi:MAG TPA: HK97 gp10 family phage protein, partial [Candidatus Paenibacillus intestinavium]|nr:HK97 gp10 family phage protein [Candidatus Paenibacillus intestinavium]